MMTLEQIRQEAWDAAVNNIYESGETGAALEFFESDIKGLFCMLRVLATTATQEEELSCVYEEFLAYCMDDDGEPLYESYAFGTCKNDDEKYEVAKMELEKVVALKDELNIKDFEDFA